jgi:hypothetical protein
MLLLAIFGNVAGLGLRHPAAPAHTSAIQSYIDSDSPPVVHHLRRPASKPDAQLDATEYVEDMESKISAFAETDDADGDRTSSEVNDSSSSGSRRGIICVTGQLARVEVESKIQNIVKPMRQHGFDVVDLVFVLDSTQNHRTNAKRETANSKGLRSVELFKNSTMLLDATKESAQDSLNTVRYVEADPSDVGISELYVKDLDRNYQKSDVTFALARAKNHAHQFEQYEGCWSAIKGDIQPIYSPSQATAGGYDLIIRARDDLYVVSPIEFSAVNELLRPNTIITSKCDQNEGMNDKGALVHPSAAERYFLRPLANLGSDAFLKSHHIINPEQFLKNSYIESGLKVRAADPDMLSWLPEAIDSHDSTCVYSCELGCYRVHGRNLGMRQCAKAQ